MYKQLTNLLQEKGNAVIILVLAFSVLLGFTALVVDGGVLYLEHTRLARAADAAVLAGAQELPQTTAARDRAIDYAQRNGVNTSTNFTVQFSPDNKQISVNITKNVNLFFAKSMGINSSNVNGRAVAKIAPVRSLKGIIPVGLDESLLPLSIGQQYTIKVGAMDISTGWTGVLELPGQSGADDYRASARNGYMNNVAVGDLMGKAPGNLSGPTIQGINDRMVSGGETWDNYAPNSAKVVVVPIYHLQGSLPADKIKIIGFASVFLEQVVGNGNLSEIKVRYINHTVMGETDDSLTNSHLNGVRLIQ